MSPDMDLSWRDAVDLVHADARIVRLLDSLAGERGLHYCAKGSGAVGLGAAPDAYAAVYARQHSLSLALTPEDAVALVTSTGCAVRAKNDTTHYVTVPTQALDDPEQLARVRTALVAAHDKSWFGPRWNRGALATTAAPVPATCPIHYLELALNGECASCYGPPPEI